MVVQPEVERAGVILPLTRDAAVQIALWLLAGALVFVVLAVIAGFRRRAWRRSGTAAGIMGALGAVAMVLAFTVAVNVPTYPVPFAARFATNPTPDTPETVASGQAIYQRLCLVCHGARGAGDGPAAFTMNPRPLPLAVHLPLHAPGEHFHWISEGIPGTSMPGWRAQLSETERWQVLRYLYALTASR